MTVEHAGTRFDPKESSEPGASLVEVFHSWQGEGLHVGRRQLFIRFAECNLRCEYCDSASAYEAPRAFSFQRADGAELAIDNPVEPRLLSDLVAQHAEPLPECPEISLTGGEPLLWSAFLAVFLPAVGRTRRVMLETNGTLPRQLERVIEHIDCVAMDIKIPSTSGIAIDADRAKSFLEIARRREVFVKIVASKGTTDGELAEAGRIVAAVDPRIPVVLQPVTAPGGGVDFDARVFARLSRRLAAHVSDVRLVAQMHRFLGAR